VPVKRVGNWAVFDASAADAATVSSLAGLIEVDFAMPPKIDQTPGIHPNIATPLSCEFARVRGAKYKRINWMEKFGEWKFALQIGEWTPGGVAEWDIDVAAAGDYRVELTYKGAGRPVWSVATSEGVKIQNQQAASPVYHSYPIGVVSFSKPGKHKVGVSLLDGDASKASLEAIRFIPAR
jgi:alpha-L-fucosidase